MTTQRFTVVHTSAGPNDDLSVEEGLLGAVGARLVRANRPPDEDALIAALSDADAVIVGAGNITERVAASLEKCQILIRTGVGYDTVDVPALTRHGIIAANLPDIWTNEVANQAFGLLLAVNRRIAEHDRLVHAGKWRGFPDIHVGELTGETIGIIGCGRIGSAIAKRAFAFGMKVIAYDPYLDAPPANTPDVQLVDELDTLLAESDYVSINCLLNDETRHLIGEAQLQRMRPHAILINSARGAIVDEAALIKALQEGWIAGTGLDVLEKEPPAPDNPLLGMERVVLTPHYGAQSDASRARMHRRVAEEVVAVLQGGWPDNPLNPEVRSHPRQAGRGTRKAAV
jgi:D-3-phosphoglycerate dehydrogenase / 2-oxoglutarate reductase